MDSDVSQLFGPCYESNVDLADWIKQERTRRGWTQQTLADRMGVLRTDVVQLETRRNKGTSARIRDSLARAFDVPPHVLPGATALQPANTVAPRFRDLPGWLEAEREARRLFGRKIPPWAFDKAGGLMALEAPEVIDATTVAGFARAWSDAASREERSDAIADHVREEMTAEDLEASRRRGQD
jgi:transcriptional regulator with XRE-family HTH domain